ncbi:MAG: hypothetical protein H7338_03900 [Candidatus Sericytochromatia bacterium]|nr:hypothetical protein [Candidatus Sericytochromatia bacterium]
MPALMPGAGVGAASAITRSAWQVQSPIPTSRYHMGFAAISGRLFTAGGLSTRLHDETESFDPKTGTWTTLAPMPTERYIGASAAVGGRLIVAGGWNHGGIDTVESYNPANNSWESLPAMPEPILAANGAALAGEMHVLGGVRGQTLLDTHYIYNPKARKWRKEGAMPFPRGGMVTAAVDDRIYCWGGWNLDSQSPTPTGAVYVGRTGKWAPLPAMPSGRGLCATTVVGNEIWVMGGGGPEGWIMDTTLIYNTDTRQWRTGAPMNTARAGSAAAGIAGRLVVAGEGIGADAPTCETVSVTATGGTGGHKTATHRRTADYLGWLPK